MNTDKIKGNVDDAAGRAKRQVGEWTGNTDAQVEGTAQQVKGKTEKAVGNIKDAVRNVERDIERDPDAIDDERDPETEIHIHRK